MLASDLISDVSFHLEDPTHVRWTLDEKLRWLNVAALQVVLVRPDAKSKTESLQLAAGTYQALPSGALRFLGLLRNMGADGATPGVAVTPADRETADQVTPDWHFEEADTVVRHFMLDPDDPTHYWVTPPVHATTAVYATVRYSLSPTLIPLQTDAPAYDSANDLVDLLDIYRGPLGEYLQYLCLTGDREVAVSAIADSHKQAFYDALGIKSAKDLLHSPKSRERPYDPTPRPESFGV